MKFKFFQLDAKEIERRVREEESRTGKRVEEVLLTREEWMEFQANTNIAYHQNPYAPPSYRLFLRRPMSFRPWMADSIEPMDYPLVTVRPE